MAAAHLMVDGYGNIYAPMLPDPDSTSGPVACGRRHIDDVVSDGRIGRAGRFRTYGGSLASAHADHHRPRRVGIVLSLIGLATSRELLAFILVAGGLGAAAFHPPAAALAHRLGGDRRGFAMSVYITGGTLGFSLGRCASRRSRSDSASNGRRCWRCPGSRSCVLSSTRPADPAASVRPARLRCAPTVCEAARAALHHRRAEDACVVDLRHVCSGHADATRPVGR